MGKLPARAIGILVLALIGLASAVQGAPSVKPKTVQAPAPLSAAQTASELRAGRALTAAETSARNSGVSAMAARSSAETAQGSLWTARVAIALSVLAVLGPYLLIWLNIRRDRASAKSRQDALDDNGLKMIKDTCDAIILASERHKDKATSTPDIWRDLSRLSALRSVTKVYLEAGSASHDVLIGISEALQINFATRDALIMRDPPGAGGNVEATPDLPRSNTVLQSANERVSLLRKQMSIQSEGTEASTSTALAEGSPSERADTPRAPPAS